MTISIGSVSYTTGTSAQVAAFLQGKTFVHKVEVVYSGTAGSYTAYVIQDTNN